MVKDSPADIEAALGAYRPNKVRDSVWAIIEPGVRDALSRVSHNNVDDARRNATALANYAVTLYDEHIWMTPQQGLPPSKPEHLDYYCNVARSWLKPSSLAGIRPRLQRMFRQLDPTNWPPATGPSHHGGTRLSPPYTDTEIRHLHRHAKSLDTKRDRPLFEMLLAAGLGAGLGSTDFRDTYATDVTTRHGLVVINIGRPTPRCVAVRRPWDTIASKCAAELGDQLLVGGHDPRRVNLVANLTAPFNRTSTVHLNAARLRNTWLLSLLVDRVDPQTIRRAAGIQELQSVERLLDLVPDLDEPDALRRMRGDS